MTLASTDKVVLGCIAFTVFWVLAVFPSVPFMPVGRTAGSLLGAMLMVLFRVMTPEDAYKAIDLPILGLLFGTMVVSIFLERADMFKYLGSALAWRSRGSKDLLFRVCLVSAVASALFTNDTCCVVLTEFILKLARQNNLPPQPFLLALASSSNIGSSATPIGNPQNLVIAVQSGITFGQFLVGVFPAMIVGVVTALASALFTNDTCCVVLTEFVLELAAERNLPAKPFLLALATSANIGSSATPIGNPQNLVIAFNSKITFLQFFFGILPAMLAGMGVNTVMLLCMYWKDLEGADEVAAAAGKEMEAVEEGRSPASVLSLKNSPTASAAAHGALRQRHGHDTDDDPDSMMSENIPTKHRWFMQCSEHRRKLFLKSFAYVVTVGMLVAYMLGLNMSWTAITTAIALVVVDFRDAEPCLDKVRSCTRNPAGRQRTTWARGGHAHLMQCRGYVQVSYSLLVFFSGMFVTVSGFNKTGLPGAIWNFMAPYAKINHVSGVTVLSLIILLLSNLASNVPTGKASRSHICWELWDRHGCFLEAKRKYVDTDITSYN